MEGVFRKFYEFFEVWEIYIIDFEILHMYEIVYIQ